MAKKVLIFSTVYLPLVGGAEVAVKEITARIPDLEFDMITARMSRRMPFFERIGNINVFRAGLGLMTLDKFILPLFGYLKFRKLNQAKKYDLIWSIMASQASIGASFAKMSQPKIKLLLTLQEGDQEQHLKRYVLGIDFLYRLLIRPWHRLVFKYADYVTAISGSLKNRAVSNGVQCPIEIVPNGVDIKHFSQTHQEAELAELKNKLGKNPQEKFIITASRLVLKNAIGDVIKALPLLPPNVKFLILGTGPDSEKLQRLVKELKVENRVAFLGYIDHKDMPKYFGISDVFIRPSLSEGLGNSFLEAMAAGIPIIGTSVGGIPDFLSDPERNPDKPPTGLFCEVRNPKSIAEKIKIFLENDELRQNIVQNARDLVVKNYDWNLIAQKIDGIFNQLTSGK